MIKLDVAKYCHNCPEFEVEEDKSSVMGFSFEEHGEIEINDTVIRCKHCVKCENIRKHLLRNFEL